MKYLLIRRAWISQDNGSREMRPFEAIVLGLVDWWMSPAEDGLPRSRPQPGPTLMYVVDGGLNQLVEQLGMPTNQHSRRRVATAIHGLNGRGWLNYIPDPLRNMPPRDQDWLLRYLPDRRTKESFGLYIPEGVRPRDSGNQVLAVWLKDVHEFGPAAAVLMAFLRWRRDNGKTNAPDKNGQGPWQASERKLAQQTGLTYSEVRTVVIKLRQAKRLFPVSPYHPNLQPHAKHGPGWWLFRTSEEAEGVPTSESSEKRANKGSKVTKSAQTGVPKK